MAFWESLKLDNINDGIFVMNPLIFRPSLSFLGFTLSSLASFPTWIMGPSIENELHHRPVKATQDGDDQGMYRFGATKPRACRIFRARQDGRCEQPGCHTRKSPAWLMSAVLLLDVDNDIQES